MCINFDCSQFLICYDQEGGGRAEEALQLLSPCWYTHVLRDHEISIDKLKFIERYSEMIDGHEKFIIELSDLEFLGEFDDWKEISEIPKKIKDLENCIHELFRTFGLERLDCLLVVVALEKTIPYIIKCKENDIIQKLWMQSRYYFGEGAYAEALLIRISK